MPDIARLAPPTRLRRAARRPAGLGVGLEPQVQQTVDDIIDDIRARGDAALLDYTARFDRWQPATPRRWRSPAERLAAGAGRHPAAQREALEPPPAHPRLRRAPEDAGWEFREADGTLLGQKVTPLDRVGLYVPGGKAAYPSSVLMNAIPAKVAGVAELIMVVPTPDGELNELVLAAAHIAGVDRAFAVGGAQAVAALAYGTERSPPATRSSAPATSTSPPPSAPCSARWASTWSPARPRS
jgi:histidinol dehydrogenase